MEVINREQEYNLIADHANNPIVHFGLQGKNISYIHAGHAWMASEVKRLRPDAKIVVKIFMPILEMFTMCGWLDHGDTFHPNYIKPYDRDAILGWCTDHGIDYVLEMNLEEFAPWHNDKDRMGAAVMLPLHNLDFDALYKPFDKIVEKADKIMVEDEIDVFHNKMLVGLLRSHLIAALSGAFDYKIKAGGKRDLYLNMAKEYIYKTYSKYEDYLLIDPHVDDDYGVPVSSSRLLLDNAGTFTKEEKAKIKKAALDFLDDKTEPTFKHTPKWLKGLSYSKLSYQLPTGRWLAIRKVK
jgi:hypothetical protein